MYVCLCTGVTDREIIAAAQRGVSDLQQLRAETGCATQCGSCADHALQLLAAQRSKDLGLRLLPIIESC